MKLLRYGPSGEEKPGILDAAGHLRDLSDHVQDIDANTLTSDRLTRLAQLDLETLPLVSGSPRLGTPVVGIGNVFCIGLNYSDHAEEMNIDAPAEPILFSKSTAAISGPNDPVMLPLGSSRSDWEVEIGVVIGERARYVSEEDALDYVAGYTIVNDLSERDFQMNRGGQWIKGKSSDTFAPIGPWLVTRDEISDPQNLNLRLDLNGERRQIGNSSKMIFSIAHVIHHISQFMTLLPGDIIATGTPPGVGMGAKPPRFLKPGDEMRLTVEGLGEQIQIVKAWGG